MFHCIGYDCSPRNVVLNCSVCTKSFFCCKTLSLSHLSLSPLSLSHLPVSPPSLCLSDPPPSTGALADGADGADGARARESPAVPAATARVDTNATGPVNFGLVLCAIIDTGHHFSPVNYCM
jgi:hypothetical protein